MFGCWVGVSAVGGGESGVDVDGDSGCGCVSCVGLVPSGAVVCGEVVRFAGASTGVIAVALPGELESLESFASLDGRPVPRSAWFGSCVRVRSASGSEPVSTKPLSTWTEP